MPINDGPLRSGDRIVYRGEQYYVRRAGTATYLHATSDLRAPHVRTARTTVLLRDAHRFVAAAPQNSSVPESSSSSSRQTDERADTAPVRRAATARRSPPRYVYVVRATDLPSTVRELKIGITHSMPDRMRAYRQRNPSDEAIIVVDTLGDVRARELERDLHTAFAAYRVDRSEVFAVRAHEVRRALAARGYRAHDDGVYRKVFV